jgi:metal-sulfur cluster biosynthetic enzyme
MLINGCQYVLRQIEGVNDVQVKLVMDPPWNPDFMTDDARDQLGIF